MTIQRATLWVGVLATLAYANAVPNGFAYDDTSILAQNEIVTEGRVLEAWKRPYWPRHSEDSGLYRPLTVSSFAAEWRVFGANPVGYHVVNVVVHATVSILVLWLLAGWTSVSGALVGASVFAVHPLHTEAVANIVGRGELYAAAFVLAALWLYDRGRQWRGLRRSGRLVAIGGLYFGGLAAKEIAVTLPGLMMLTDFLDTRTPGTAIGDSPKGHVRARGLAGVWSEFPVYVICVAALLGYLVVRTSVVGALLGDLPAPSLRGLSTSERLATAMSLWPHFVRLLVFPLSLSADYSPAVLFPVRSLVSVDALVGLMLLATLGAAVVLAWKRAPLIAFGIAWFGVAVSPISQILFPTGVLLAERTLYLPSVAVAAIAAGAWAIAHDRGSPDAKRFRRGAHWVVAVVVALMLARTVARNPTWMSTFTVLDTLAREHPESSLALRTRATGLVRAGDFVGGAEMYETAVELAPANYSILTEVGHFYGERRAWLDGDRLLRQAVSVSPDRAAAYRLLTGQLIVQERYREAHKLAWDGLAAAGADRELFALVSETYVAKGDIPAALRARHAALGQDPESVSDLSRLGDLYEMAGDTLRAERTRARALRARAAEVRIAFTPTGRIVHRAPAPGEESGP